MKDKHSEKQKVTFYVPQELHHKLKVQAALDCEPMSTIAERAIQFYLTHGDIVDDVEDECSVGRSYQVHSCPECSAKLVIKEGELASIKESLVLASDAVPESPSVLDSHYADKSAESDCLNGVNKEKLVPC